MPCHLIWGSVFLSETASFPEEPKPTARESMSGWCKAIVIRLLLESLAIEWLWIVERERSSLLAFEFGYHP
jgi:hypothetical protein